MPISAVAGNANASSPQQSGKAVLIDFSGGFCSPISVAFADTPYTIPNNTLPLQLFLVTTAGGAVTVNLPDTPVNGQIIIIKRTSNSGNDLTVGRNGSDIEGAAADITLAAADLAVVQLQYDSTSGSWWIINKP